LVLPQNKYKFNMKKFTYVIGWNTLNINSGGQIVLYFLCHMLNKIGQKAYMSGGSFPNVLDLDCPIKPKYLDLQLDNVVTIYPEVTNGNPLNAKNVARWILYTIGINGGSTASHGKNDLILGYQKEFSGNGCFITDENKVTLFYIMNNIYYNFNPQPRTRSCFMIRKGNRYHTQFNSHPIESIDISGKSHKELSAIFNLCHTFYCYDPHTYYSTYASMCGCDSIIIPSDNLSKTDWKNSIEDTYGIAYGIDDLERAGKTRPLMLDYIKNQDNSNIENTHKFVELCESHF
jgi:hypothetical protein